MPCTYLRNCEEWRNSRGKDHIETLGHIRSGPFRPTGLIVGLGATHSKERWSCRRKFADRCGANLCRYCTLSRHGAGASLLARPFICLGAFTQLSIITQRIPAGRCPEEGCCMHKKQVREARLSSFIQVLHRVFYGMQMQ